MEPIEVTKDSIRTRPKLVKKMRLVMFLGLIGGPIVFGIGVYDFLQMKSLKTKGITVDAEVQDVSILNTGKGRRVYKVVADYHPDGYPIHRKEFVVRKGEYDTADTSRKISVTFLAAKPSVSSAGDEVRSDTEPMAIGVGVFVVASMILFYFKKKDKEIEKAIFGEAQQQN
jgi:hypothetical protein